MALSNNENKLKSILSEESFDIDTGNIWAGVKDHIPQESRRRVIPFWITLSGLIGMVSLIAVSIILLNNPTEDSSLSDDAILQSEQGEEKTSTILNESTDIIAIEESKSSLLGIDEVANNISKNDIIAVPEKTNIIEDKLSTTSKSNTPTLAVNSKVISKQRKITDTNSSFSPTLMTVAESTNDVSSSTESSPVSPKVLSRNKISLAMLSILTLDPFEIQKKAILNSILALDFSPKIIIQKDRKLPLFYSLNAGTNYSIGEWKSTASDPINLSGFDQSVAGLSGSFTLGYSLNKNWDIIGGMGYTQSIYRYNNQSTGIEQRSEDGIIEIIIDSEGNPIPVNGSISTEVTVNNDIQWHRKHLYLDALLAIRYNVGIAKGWFAHIQGGANYTIYQQHSGYYRDDANTSKIIKLEENNSHPYAANPFSFSSNIGIHKTMGAIDLSLNWGVRLSPFNQLNNNTIYTLKNSQTDLQLGITYRPGWE